MLFIAHSRVTWEYQFPKDLYQKMFATLINHSCLFLDKYHLQERVWFNLLEVQLQPTIETD